MTLLKTLFVYLEGRERERSRENFSLLPLSHLLAQLGLGQAEIGTQEINLGAPHGWHRPNSTSLHLLPPSMLISTNKNPQHTQALQCCTRTSQLG